MTTTIAVVAYLLGVWITWVLFLAVMNLERAKKRWSLTKIQQVMGLPIVVIGYLLDVFYNVTLCTVLFLELPKEPTISQRLERYIKDNETDWRHRQAMWWRETLLADFDKDGSHGNPGGDYR